MTLHTKYRPTKFDEVIGQDAVVKALAAILKKGSSQTFLFNGPSGTGKTTLARIIAYEKGCEDKDILEIDAATYTGIDDMRAITSNMMYRPIGGGIRCIIIDESHALSRQSWQSILKALEEPAPYNFIVLCTTELGKIPDTIKTRCSRFELKEVSSDLLFDLIKDVAEKEKLIAAKSDGVLELCAKEAQGSPRQALVNLGVCGSTADRKEAAQLLKSAEGSSQAHDLARALLTGTNWMKVQQMLLEMKDMNGESIRQVVRAYMTNTILNAQSEKVAGKAAEILDAFGTPFYYSDGISPVILACVRLLLS